MTPQPTLPPIGRPVLVTITREAFARASRFDPNRCALAEALRDKFNIRERDDVGVVPARVRVEADGQDLRAPNSIRAERFITRFDAGKPVRLPVTFRFTFHPATSKGAI